MAFEPINTQEEFDAAIADRLSRAKEAVRKEYADYEQLKEQAAAHEKSLGEANDKIAGYEKSLGELETKLRGYETASVKTRAALDAGLPYTMADQLTGADEAAIRKDALELARMWGAGRKAPPLAESDPAESKEKQKNAILEKWRNELMNKGD